MLYYGAHYGNALLPFRFDQIKGGLKTKTRIEFKKQLPNLFDATEMGRFEKYTTIDVLIHNYKAIVTLSKLDYFKNVYLPNSDIFAFLLVYLK